MNDILICNLENIHAIADERGCAYIVWEHEGEFNNGKWVFDADHQDFEPVLLDNLTARMLQAVFAALKPETSERAQKAMAKSRAAFVRFVEKGWECTTLK